MKKRSPSGHDTTASGNAAAALAPMDIDEVNPKEKAPGTELTDSNPRGKTPRKGRKRSSKGAMDEDPAQVREVKKSGRDGKKDVGDGDGAGGGDGGADGSHDEGDTPEPKTKRSRRSSLSNKDSRGKSEGRSRTQTEEPSTQTTSSKNMAPTKQESSEAELSSGNSLRNGDVVEAKSEPGGTPGKRAEEKAKPLKEDDNEGEKEMEVDDTEAGAKEEQPTALSSEPPRNSAASKPSDDVRESISNSGKQLVPSEPDSVAPVADAVEGGEEGDTREAEDDGTITAAVATKAQAQAETETETEKQADETNATAASLVTIRVDNFVRPFTASQAKKVWTCYYQAAGLT